MSKSKHWLVRNQDNEYSEWSDMITHGLLLQWACNRKSVISSNAIRFLHYCGTGTAHPSGAPEFKSVFIVVRITQSLALCVCFVDRCLSLCTLSFCHCVVCSSSIYGFWLPLWYLQIVLVITHSFTYTQNKTPTGPTWCYPCFKNKDKDVNPSKWWHFQTPTLRVEEFKT
jgi:hypothetical protein